MKAYLKEKKLPIKVVLLIDNGPTHPGIKTITGVGEENVLGELQSLDFPEVFMQINSCCVVDINKGGGYTTIT